MTNNANEALAVTQADREALEQIVSRCPAGTAAVSIARAALAQPGRGGE